MRIATKHLKYASTEKQREAVRAVLHYGSIAAACTALGANRSSFKGQLERVLNRAKEAADEGRCVGIIGDTHIPYERAGYLDFCQETFEREGVTHVHHAGDLIDNHALSFHDSEPALKGAYGEREDALRRLEPWKKAFPKLTISRGNHDIIPARQIKKIGMDPEVYLRPLAEIYEFPPGWELVEEIVIDGVLYHHGETAGGQNGFRLDAARRMQSTVTGHNHSNLGVSWTANDHRAVWGLAVGCGIDSKSMAFAYGRHFKYKPVVGCGVVKRNGTMPLAFAMDLGER